MLELALPQTVPGMTVVSSGLRQDPPSSISVSAGLDPSTPQFFSAPCCLSDSLNVSAWLFTSLEHKDLPPKPSAPPTSCEAWGRH